MMAHPLNLASNREIRLPLRGSTPCALPPGFPTRAADASVERNTNAPDVPAYRPGVQHVNLVMQEKDVEIAPDTVVRVWTFGRVGDLVEVTITNRHSIDFHAARIAPNRAFRDVPPGESFSFSFTADDPGVFMYHCGTAPVVHHIANGMYGMIIVEPEGGLPPVDREWPSSRASSTSAPLPASTPTTPS